jgi:hypothetical protein
MSKKAYLDNDIVQEILCAIELLCERDGYTSPTVVLRLLKMDQTDFTRSLVRDIAHNWVWCSVESSGRGIRITLDNFNGDIPF